MAEESNSGAADLRPSYWLYRLLPAKAAAYGQLARLDRPIGRQLLFWPCIWGLLLACYANNLSWRPLRPLSLPKADFLPLAFAHYHTFSVFGFCVFAALLFLIGSVVMRGAGCAYNDIADYKIDAQVARTVTRPLPAGRVSRRQAAAFIALQCFIGLLVLLQMPVFSIILAFCSLGIVALYPFMKRLCDWPQAVLGLAFNWGILVGFSALSGGLAPAAWLLYGGAVCWTIGYDTIYAHQDREYDAMLGMGSTALLFGRRSKAALCALYALMAAGLAGSFWLAGAGLWAFAGIAAAIACLIWQICRFDMDNPALCLALFQSNRRVGFLAAVPAAIGLFWR